MSVRKILATGAIAVSAFTAGAAIHAPHYANPVAHVCKSEDSNNCRWDATRNGNGQGDSFIVTKSGNVFYFDPSMSAHPSKPFYGIRK
jgi:hypothetical protein